MKRNCRFSDRCLFDELRRGRFLASEKSTMVIDLNDLEAITKLLSSLFAASSKKTRDRGRAGAGARAQ